MSQLFIGKIVDAKDSQELVFECKGKQYILVPGLDKGQLGAFPLPLRPSPALLEANVIEVRGEQLTDGPDALYRLPVIAVDTRMADYRRHDK